MLKGNDAQKMEINHLKVENPHFIEHKGVSIEVSYQWLSEQDPVQ